MTNPNSIIFNRAVNFILPNSIPTHFDRTEEYKLGDMLVYENKLRPLMPWRKYMLVFTGVNIADVLTESIHMDTNVQEVFSKGRTTRAFGESAQVDGQISYAIASLGIKIAETERASIAVDFGKIDRYYSNLSELFSWHQAAEKKFRVLTEHPVIKDAMAHNKTLFVINNLYVAEKVNISLKFTDDSMDASVDSKMESTNPPTNNTATAANNPATVAGNITTTTTTTATGSAEVPLTTSVLTPTANTIGGDIAVTITKSGQSVIYRYLPTNIAYRVMRFKLDSHANLLPKFRSAIHHIKVRVVDEMDLGGTNVGNRLDVSNQNNEQCEYTHNRFEVMVVREDETELN